MTAIALTELAIMSFSSKEAHNELDGLLGIIVGIIMILIGIYIFFAPRISIVDRKHNSYKAMDASQFTCEEFTIQLTHSKLYGNYVYHAKLEDEIIDGVILKEKSPIFNWPIWYNYSIRHIDISVCGWSFDISL